jgi:hypothetical protein
MKIKFGKIGWGDLIKIRNDVRNRMVTNHLRETRAKLMDGLADAIDAEIKRLEMEGGRADGMITLSIDLNIEPHRLVEYDESKKRNLLAELDDILNRSTRK